MSSDPRPTTHDPRLLLIALLAVGCHPPSIGPQAEGRVYVANQENASVTILDARGERVLRTLDLTTLGFSPNCKPHHVAVEPDGSYWYVTLITDGRVLKFTRGDSLVGQARMEVPGMIALDPRSDRMVVGRSMSAVNPPSRVAILRRSTMTVDDELDVPFPRPHAVALSPDGEWAYVASLAENRMASIRLATGDVRVQAIEGPLHGIVQFAVSPDGRTLVGSGQLSNRLLVFDLADPADPRPRLPTIQVGASPWDPVFSPTGDRVWLANLDANTVTAVRTRDWAIDNVVADSRLAQPNGLAVSANGRTVFVANRNQRGAAHLHDATHDAGTGFVAVIDADSYLLTRILPSGRYAAGVGVPARR